MGTQVSARREVRRNAFARRERELAAIAARQHGLIARRQLVDTGLSLRTIGRRVEAGRLRSVHRGVYALGPGQLDQRGHWMAAVLACGDQALLSHRSAAALWGLMRSNGSLVEVTAPTGRRRQGITVHQGGISETDRAVVAGIPITSVARTLLDLAEVVGERSLEKAFEEADRLRLLEMPALEAACSRGHGRRGIKPIRRLIEAAHFPETTRSSLEDDVLALCREHGIPLPHTNVMILDHEVDALWPRERLIVEADSWSFHRHRAAFERDRARDAAMQAEGYRVIRLTHRRLNREPAAVATELRRLLASNGRAET